MPSVTGVERTGRRLAVVFDDGSSLRCDRGFELAKSFRVGQLVEGAILERVRLEAARHEADTAARRWLRRPRSRADVAHRLGGLGIPRAVIDETLNDLEAKGYLDDRAYAGAWTADRVRNRPRAARAVRDELRARGIDGELAREATEGLDDDALALELARQRAPRNADFTQFQRRVGAALQRRGFSYEVSRRALEQAWAERNGDAPAEMDAESS